VIVTPTAFFAPRPSPDVCFTRLMLSTRSVLDGINRTIDGKSAWLTRRLNAAV
jgi:hypothetical protein